MSGWHVPLAWHEVPAQHAPGFCTQLPEDGMQPPEPDPPLDDPLPEEPDPPLEDPPLEEPEPGGGGATACVHCGV